MSESQNRVNIHKWHKYTSPLPCIDDRNIDNKY